MAEISLISNKLTTEKITTKCEREDLTVTATKSDIQVDVEPSKELVSVK
jgi:hypothetical protein